MAKKGERPPISLNSDIVIDGAVAMAKTGIELNRQRDELLGIFDCLLKWQLSRQPGSDRGGKRASGPVGVKRLYARG